MTGPVRGDCVLAASTACQISPARDASGRRFSQQVFQVRVTACHPKSGDTNPEKDACVTAKNSRHVTVKSHKGQSGSLGIWPWTQTGMPCGISSDAQIQSIAGTLTRTQPCDAG